MTPYMQNKPYTYAGLCLNNMLEVCTNEEDLYIALGDIMFKIMDGIAISDKLYSDLSPSQTITPYVNMSGLYPIINKRLHNKHKCYLLKKHSEHLEMLKPYLEVSEIDLDPILKILFENPEVNLDPILKFTEVKDGAIVIKPPSLSIISQLIFKFKDYISNIFLNNRLVPVYNNMVKNNDYSINNRINYKKV